MVSQLFDPMQPKNASDIAIVTVLGFMCTLFYLLPPKWRIRVFAVIFIFWRLCYNAGIGWLLHNQSHYKRLTLWAKNSKIFENPKTGNQRHPTLWKFLKREMEAKIPEDYKFDDAPLEYNTWLLFRRVVDLILMSDFVAYCLFAMACGGRPAKRETRCDSFALGRRLGFGLLQSMGEARCPQSRQRLRLVLGRLLLSHRPGAHIRWCIRACAAPNVLSWLCWILRHLHDGSELQSAIHLHLCTHRAARFLGLC